MQVVSLSQYRSRELVAALKDLLELAERGQVRGLAFVAKIGRHGHRAGLTGDYSRNPDEALLAAVRLKEKLLQESLGVEAGHLIHPPGK